MIINLFPVGEIAEPVPLGTWSFTVTYDTRIIIVIRFDLDQSYTQTGVNCTITSVIYYGMERVEAGTVSSYEGYSTWRMTAMNFSFPMNFTCTVTHGTDSNTQTFTVTG